jgi:hypothetical protein
VAYIVEGELLDAFRGYLHLDDDGHVLFDRQVCWTKKLWFSDSRAGEQIGWKNDVAILTGTSLASMNLRRAATSPAG